MKSRIQSSYTSHELGLDYEYTNVMNHFFTSDVYLSSSQVDQQSVTTTPYFSIKIEQKIGFMQLSGSTRRRGLEGEGKAKRTERMSRRETA